MTIDQDDPKLTAFALDELDPAERAEIEAALAADEAAQGEIAAIQKLGDLLGQELTKEEAPALTELQRARIEREAAGVGSAASAPAGQVIRPPQWLIPAAAAAGVLLVAGLGLTFVNNAQYDRAAPRMTAEAAYAEDSHVSLQKPADETQIDGVLGSGSDGEFQLELVERAADGASLEAASEPVPKPGEASGRAPERRRAYEAAKAEAEADDLAGPAPRAPRDAPAADPAAPPAAQPNTAHTASKEANESGDLARLETKAKQDLRGLRESVDEEERSDPDRLSQPVEPPSGEQFDRIVENPFVTTDPRREDSLFSTFGADVDTASYSNVRRYLIQQNSLPPADAVRIEELINYFPYDYAAPDQGAKHPFKANVEVAECPWNKKHRLVRVGIKAKEIELEERPASNLVFLLDVSGSMRARNKLPLLQQAFSMMIEQLDARDKISIVVYAGAAGVVLPPTPANNQRGILDTFRRLRAGGSTNGGAGIQLAYKLARDNFIEGGVNRVILATDGDFNVGVRSRSELIDLIERQAKSGVFLSLFGFGMGNLKDGTMEQLADKGNGQYAYIDSLAEAEKALVDGLSGTLITVAKDLKIQLVFNHGKVKRWRQIGYENRKLDKEDFLDDDKDAGEVGAGHTVTARYEVDLEGALIANPFTDQPAKPAQDEAMKDVLLELRLNYKQPDSEQSLSREEIGQAFTYRVLDSGQDFYSASPDFQFAAAVAAFGMILRNSSYQGDASLAKVQEWAAEAKGQDPKGYRAGFVELVQHARRLTGDRR